VPSGVEFPTIQWGKKWGYRMGFIKHEGCNILSMEELFIYPNLLLSNMFDNWEDLIW
jgi:hypothetical protein